MFALAFLAILAIWGILRMLAVPDKALVIGLFIADPYGAVAASASMDEMVAIAFPSSA